MTLSWKRCWGKGSSVQLAHRASVLSVFAQAHHVLRRGLARPHGQGRLLVPAPVHHRAGAACTQVRAAERESCCQHLCKWHVLLELLHLALTSRARKHACLHGTRCCTIAVGAARG